MSDDYAIDWKAYKEELRPIKVKIMNAYRCPDHGHICSCIPPELKRAEEALRRKHMYKYIGDKFMPRKPNPYRYLPHIAKPLVAPEGYEYGWKTSRSPEDVKALYEAGWHPVGYLDPKWEIPKNAQGYYAVDCALLCMRAKPIEVRPLESYAQSELKEEILLRCTIDIAEDYAMEMWKEYGERTYADKLITQEYRCNRVAMRVHEKYPDVKCEVKAVDRRMGNGYEPIITITRRVKRPSIIEQMLPALEADSVMRTGVTRADHALAWKCGMEGIADIPPRYTDGDKKELAKVNAKPYVHEVHNWEDDIWKPIMEGMDDKLDTIESLEKLGFKVSYE